MHLRNKILIIFMFFLSGCASNLPLEITTPIEGSPPVADVLQNINMHKGAQVRWGGSIASIKNKKDETWIEIVALELNRSGRPKKSDESAGRFLAVVGQFLDPEIYNKGRLITVYGDITDMQKGMIDEQPYTFPVVNASKALMWPKRRDPVPMPYYHQPFYDPFYDPYWDLRWSGRYFYGHPRYWY